MRKLFASVPIGILTLVILVRTGALAYLLSANYLPHGYCYLAQSGLVWANVVTDGLIGASYILIFTFLFWIVSKLHRAPKIQTYLWVFISFGIFIAACASTHLMEIVTVWWPVYRLSVAFKVVCAAASIITAILLSRAAPEIVKSLLQFFETLSAVQREHATDTIELIRIHGRVKETEARLQAILDSVVDSIITVDGYGSIVSVNPATVKMFAYEAEELLGRNVKMLMPELDRASHDGHLARYQSTGMTRAIGVRRELEGLTKMGKVFPIELTITEGSPDGQRLFVGLIRDISGRSRVEDELKKRAALLDLAQDAILVRDLENRVIFWNRAAERMYGWSAAEASGRVTHDLLQTRFPCALEAIDAELASKGDWEGELRHTTRQGAELVVAGRWSLQKGDRGESLAILEVNRDITDRKRAEAELREKEHLLSESQRIAHIGSWTCDLDDPAGRLVWSDELYRIYEVTPETFTPTVEGFIDRIFPEDQTAMRRWIAACTAGEKPADLEFRLLHQNGTVHVFSRRGELQYDSKNRPIRLAGTTQDITEQKRAQLALNESEERFHAMANGMPQLAWMAEADGSIFWYNSRWYEYTGTTFAQMQGWGWRSVIHADTLPKVMKEWTSAILAGKLFDMEFPLLGADGSFRVFLTRVMPIKDSAGRVVRWFGTNTDISERKQAEERLAAQAEELAQSREALEAQKIMLQSVLDSMVEGLVVADEQGKFILFNPAAEKIIGLGASDTSPQAWSAHYGTYMPDMVTPIPPGQTPLERAIRGEVCTGEIFLRQPGLDRGVWIEANGAPLRDKEGVGRGGVVAFRDITQRKADELEIRKLNEQLEARIAVRTAQLETANHELEAFTYSVSHDLRAPLRHIGGFSRILMHDFGPALTLEARGHLQRIEEAVIRMGLLVDALLGLARLGRQSLTLRNTELNDLVKEAISVLEPDCEGRVVEWRIAQLPALECDRVLIGQVFQNLLGNALKYSRGRTKAVIEIDSIPRPGEGPIILVRDNGAGFNMKYAGKLFDVFQRMHTESEFEGTGVGLATVHRIIQRHGGSIWAEAEVDHGATFYFTLGVTKHTSLVETPMASGTRG